MPNPFISRDDLSDLLGRDVTNDDGAIIACDAACDAIRTMTEQEVNRSTSTVTLDGAGTDALVLPQYPVNGAGTVVVSGGTVTDYVLDAIKGALIRKADESGIDWSAGLTWRPDLVVWPQGRQNVVVTYDHGWSDNDIPRDLRFVALAYASRVIVQGPASREQSGQQAVSYAVASTDFTNGELMVLRKYKRR